MSPIDPSLDLMIQRVIHASPSAIWRAWTEAELLQKWWIPAPLITRVDQLDVRPGGAFVTSMSEDGQDFVTHTDSIFLVVEPKRRIAFTNAVTSAWRPVMPSPVALTAEMTFTEHPEGTDYRAIVRHGDPAARDLHEELGFFEGWGSVIAALADLVEGEAAT